VSNSTESDYSWLVSGRADTWLRLADSDDGSLVTLVSKLRRELSAERVRLVLEQVELRRRARDKFAQAAQMFFTPRGLEQATDENIAAYKAARFDSCGRIADLCCGIGGDLLGLAAKATVIAVDRDPIALVLAKANCRANGHGEVQFESTDVKQFALSRASAWHLDPDRRTEGRRTTRIDRCQPDETSMDRMLGTSSHAAIKLAPTADVPPSWTEAAELEWIGHRRECQQLVAWFGSLARHVGQASATVLLTGFSDTWTVRGERNKEIPRSRGPARYIIEPHASVLAARLTGAVAEEHGLSAFSSTSGYLTSDRLIADSVLSVFEVTDSLPFDVKRLRSLLRERRIGQLEVKKRGVPHDPEQLRRQLRVPGDNAATLVVARIDRQVVAIVCQRVGDLDSKSN
jgi:hypothetical protein